ncbi:Zn-dependent carboxypeptidase [Edwardsiella piscicida]|uniref:Metal-dependent carboxypeptidase n=3 Tax=Edwardsiella TaxID=635 RepID=A0A0H3DQT5_EDWTF|nr:carboxypeptidase M32 [Edwardsiella piscicida]ACY84593.1 Zn-dependent carboxypeptidase [Edwardsiella tarda EIB202]ADM41696.1 carboxypeptidase [Edwardsiella tarda FL6-60]ARD19909.1 carboxypeptidase M32 [Edwardsiella piscicida]MDM3863373.1 carboxypeptidase M32 [Edwardsiella piscicida]QHR94203.1 carboxypeptidase M32 [Edwardsiella piscicida]
MTSAYQRLETIFQRLARFDHLSAIAGWDMQTYMPSGGSGARSAALTELSLLMHRILCDEETGVWLQRAAQESLSDEQRANVAEMQRRYARASLLPAALVEEKSLAGMRCEHAWRTQRANNDWHGFMENLRPVVRLSREEAKIRADHAGCSRYDALLDLYEPGMNSARLDTLFGEIKGWLPTLLQRVVERQQRTPPRLPRGPFDEEAQRQLGLRIMAQLGFDFAHGRLDVSAHPFCGGVPQDVRITTRYNRDDFLSALLGIVHETGHARYEQNLPSAWAGQPLGEARSTAIHESQSLFFEMQLARSHGFLNFLRPWVIEAFGDDPAFSAENFVRLNQRVKPGYIRVDADEVSYPAHIILRYEIERALIEGEIEVEDIPALWDSQMRGTLGLSTAGNYRDGCMQDIHWTDGAFGYFPTYTLGAMYAAQLYAAARRDIPDLPAQIAASDIAPIGHWLRQHIWCHGSRWDTDTLIRNVCGEPLNPDYLRRHLEQRYLGSETDDSLR